MYIDKSKDEVVEEVKENLNTDEIEVVEEILDEVMRSRNI